MSESLGVTSDLPAHPRLDLGEVSYLSKPQFASLHSDRMIAHGWHLGWDFASFPSAQDI